MEKTVEKSGTDIRRIILTGPESTGKTMLTMELASRYRSPFIPEYAREYILNLRRPYTYDDVIHIARKQIEQMKEFSKYASGYLFVDTYLIITKIWFDKVFNKIPEWINKEIAKTKTKNCFYLLCLPDIPWEPDPVRENGGPMRQVLFDLYELELKKAGLNYSYVKGLGEARIICAMKQITTFYNLK
jgi:nicotinamide riboside kinase